MRTSTPVTKRMREARLAEHFSNIDASLTPIARLQSSREEADKSFTNLVKSRRASRLVSKIAIASTSIALVSEYLGLERTAKLAGIVAGISLTGTAVTTVVSDNLQEIHQTIESSTKSFAANHLQTQKTKVEITNPAISLN